MNIILKHTLKNIIGKPLRSLILVICVMVTCITAFFTLDLSGTISDMFTAYMADMLGSLDLRVSTNKILDMSMFDELPDSVVFSMASTGYNVATRNPEEYSYEYVQPLTIYGVDVEKATQFGLFGEDVSINDGEVGISESYAETFKYEVGDVIDLYDEKGETHPYTVTAILPEYGVFISEGEYTAIVTENEIKILLGRDDIKYYAAMVDVVNDDEIDAFCDYVEENYHDIEIMRIKGNEDIQDAVDELVSLFAIFFVVTFLMVIFVTIALSEKIVNERMSVIGTLRSVGISPKLTAAILLAENVLYGVLGYGAAVPIYLQLRKPIMGSMIMVMQGEIRVQPMQTWIYVVILVGAVFVECFTPLKELTKAVKIPIREIIFSNKDADYHFSKKRTIAGTVFLVIGVVCAFINVSVVLTVSIVFMVFGMSMLMPEIIRFVSLMFGKLFTKIGMPTAELASKEMGTKKSTVSNSVLCLVISALAIVLFGVSNGIEDICDYDDYIADVYGMGALTELDNYRYIEDIEGVTEVEYIHSAFDSVEINGKESKNNIEVTALTNSDMFVGLSDLPESLAKDEIVISKAYAEKNDINEGDTIEVVFKTEYLFPITKSLKVVKYTDSGLYSASPVIIVNPDVFESLYHEMTSYILIKCEDPDAVKAEIDKHSLNQTMLFQTRAEYDEETEKQSAGIKAALYAVIAFGVILSIIGLSGNQTIGFEARRREYAILYSTSMSRKQIRKLIFIETFLSMGSSIVVGSIFGYILCNVAEKAAYMLSYPIPITLMFNQYVVLTAVLIVIFTVTSLQPLKLIKKMKIAEELKYE